MWLEDGMFGREASSMSKGSRFKGFHAECCTSAACSVYANGGENSGWVRSKSTCWPSHIVIKNRERKFLSLVVYLSTCNILPVL